MSDNYPPGSAPEPPGGSGDSGNIPSSGSPQGGVPGQGGVPDQGGFPPQGGSPTPPPPPPPPPMAGAAGAAPVAQQANVGEAISWAFSKFGPNAKVLVIFALVPAAVSLIASFFNARIANFDTTRALTAGQIGELFGGLALAIAAGVLTLLALMGLINAALKITRGETPELGDFWHPNRAVNYILVSVVMAVGIWVGLMLCIIPGLILYYAWQFAQYSALGTDNGVAESLKESWNLVMANKLPALLALVVGVVATFVTELRWIGPVLTLFVVPAMVLFYAHLYRQFRGEQIAA